MWTRHATASIAIFHNEINALRSLRGGVSVGRDFAIICTKCEPEPNLDPYQALIPSLHQWIKPMWGGATIARDYTHKPRIPFRSHTAPPSPMIEYGAQKIG